MKKSFCAIILVLFTFNAVSVETCSRIAVINYQEVLVDSNSSDKGEGLRFHLEKDKVAREYLDIYQKNSSLYWPNALVGTTGTALLFYGFFNNKADEKAVLLISGASLIFINFLIAKTLEVTNEANLNKAIDEYNKRNLPKIYFSPDESRGQNDFFQYKVGVLKSWSF